MVGAASRVLERKRFSSLFIDEAAQAIEAACWIAISRADRVILAGDHCQLPPTIKCIEAARGGLGRTLLEKVVLHKPETVSLLKIQYRMHEDIMRFPSRWFYHDELEAAPEVKYRGVLDFDTPASWIDTSELDLQEKAVAEGTGRLNTGDVVLVKDSSDSTYWYVYAPGLDKSGYVDNRYIYNSGLWTVKVETGYLALRNKAAYNESNEIGQLNTGDTVQVKDTSNDQYWYVYVPQLDKTGYVDRNYLTGGSGTTTPSMTVKVESGYLALRSTKAYDKDNEIAQLNNGDTVEVIEKKDSTYWYVYVPKLGKEGYVDKNYLK